MGNVLRSLSRGIKRKERGKGPVYRFSLTEKGRKDGEVAVFLCDGCGRVVSGDDLDERYDCNMCLECAVRDDEEDED